MMEDLDEVMFDEGDFEVVDECTGEEDPSPSPMDTENSAKGESTSESVEILESVDSSKQKAEVAEDPVILPKRPVVDGPDFTEDVELDGPQPCKGDSNDGDTLVLDSSEILCCDIKDTDGKSDAPNSVDDSKETDSVVELIPPEHAWYEEKLNTKMNIVKERLSKLARVLELSYPAYKPWLEHSKSSVCHFDPPRRCPLDKPHTNRWKFICSRKTVQESTNKEEDSAEGTVNKKLETVWRLGPTDGSGLNTDNASQYPPFVMRVVKVFEEFIQNIERSLHEEAGTDKESSIEEVRSSAVEEKSTPDVIPLETPAKDESNPTIEEVKVDDDITEETPHSESGFAGDRNHNWLWLLVRSNSKDELMVFATGKKISAATMQKLKQTFETGAGKDCNVKSLYCKSIDPKSGNTAGTSNITFLAGTEALDETVGGVKIQLAPKTNFWCNASGVEQLGAAVGDMLSPLQKSTVIEVGCGLGLIGLMVASKCKKVLGLDAPSEVEEAEMTSELNKVQNASFVMGQTSELITKVTTLLKNTKASAIVNGNTKLGRDIEMMTALRKIPSLRRVVMITTLTKQSVRAILELTRPADADLGNPFMPLRAILVDTLPTGPHFEVVIRMERLNLENVNEPWFWNHVKFRAGLSPNELPRKNPPHINKVNVQGKKGGVKNSPGQVNTVNAARRSNNRANRRNKVRKQKAAAWTQMVPGTVTGVVRNLAVIPAKTATGNLVKNPMAGKASGGKPKGKNVPADKTDGSKKPGTNVQQTKPVEAATSSEQPAKDSPLSPDPSNPVKVARSSKGPSTSPLKKNPLAKGQPGRQRLSGAQKRKRHWATMEAQKKGGGNNNQGPSEKRMRGNDNRGDLRGRLSGPRIMQQVQNQQMLLNMAQQRLGGQGPMVDVDTAKQLQNMLNIVLDQTNKLQNQLPRSVWHRIAPPDNNYQSPGHQSIPNNQGNPIFRDRFVQNMGPQDIVITTPNSEFGGNLAPVPLFNRPALDRTKILPAGMNPQELRGRQDSLRGISESMQGGRNYRKNQGNDWNPTNQVQKNREPIGNKNSSLMPLMESIARPPSPKRSLLSPSRAVSPPRRYASSSYSQHDKRQLSPPPRRQASPPRRELSPSQRKNPYSEIFHRRPVQNRPQSSENSRRGTSPARRDHSSSGRGLSSPKRFSDDWDMNRGNNMDQGNWNQRQQGQMQQRSLENSIPDRRWSSDKTENSQNWNSSSMNDRFRQNANKRGDGRDGMWMSGGGDVWNSKQMSGKSGNERQWPGGNNGQGPSGDQWNPRGNDSYGQSNNRNDNWRNSGKGEKQWMDLPEDAKDPWGDDPGLPIGKSRWQSDEPSNSNWGRNDKIDQNWSNKSNDNNWQNKGGSMSNNMPKPLWPSFANQNSNNQQRWMPQNEPKNSIPSNNWQGNNFGSNNWRQQNYSGFSQQQRHNSYGSSNYKDGR